VTYAKEKDFQTAVIQAATLKGWRVAHFGNTVKLVRKNGGVATIPDKGAAGFPDLVMVRRDRIIFVELKLDKGRTSVNQNLWLDDLREAGQTTFVWRPADWDFILACLS
jgi:hypothetical protein